MTENNGSSEKAHHVAEYDRLIAEAEQLLREADVLAAHDQHRERLCDEARKLLREAYDLAYDFFLETDDNLKPELQFMRGPELNAPPGMAKFEAQIESEQWALKYMEIHHPDLLPPAVDGDEIASTETGFRM